MLLVGWGGGGGGGGVVVRQTSVCSSNVGSTTVLSTLLIMYFCVLCVYFLLASPISLGAWSMALVLCQRLEYNYNYYFPLKLRKMD